MRPSKGIANAVSAAFYLRQQPARPDQIDPRRPGLRRQLRSERFLSSPSSITGSMISVILLPPRQASARRVRP